MRGLYKSPQCSTDGVYKALTEMRIRTPWVEALKKQREEGSNPTKTPKSPATPQDRDLMPKKMSESFTRVVSGNPLCDPLSDAVLRGSDLFLKDSLGIHMAIRGIPPTVVECPYHTTLLSLRASMK